MMLANHRHERVAEEIHHEVSAMLADSADARAFAAGKHG